MNDGKYHPYAKGMKPPCKPKSRIVVIDTHGISTWCNVEDIDWPNASIVAFKVNYVSKEEENKPTAVVYQSPFDALKKLVQTA